MNQHKEPKDEPAGRHFGHLESRESPLAPGKRTLVEEATFARPSASHNDEQKTDIRDLKTNIRRAYLGGHGYESAGIINYRLTAIQAMGARLATPVSADSSVFDDAIALGVEFAAAALTAIAKNPYVGAAVDGLGTALGKAFRNSSRKSIPIRNAYDFVSHYDSIFREHIQDSADRLVADIDTVPEGQKTLGRINELVRHEGDKIKAIQSNELLDAWSNVLKAADQGVRPAGMGKNSFLNAAVGRLHIQGILLNTGSDPSTLELEGLSAKLMGVSAQASDLLLDRYIKDIKVARTFEGSCKGRIAPPPPNHLPDTAFSFGVPPDGNRLVDGTISNIADASLASWSAQHGGAKDSHDALRRIWEHVKEQPLRRYVHNIDE